MIAATEGPALTEQTYGQPSAATSATTMMVLNIPHTISMKDFLLVLNSSGFEGVYNFCHIPRNLRNGRNNGYAFLNFDSPDSAQLFLAEWDGRRMFRNGKKLKIQQARLRGMEACLCVANKSKKKRSSKFQPLLSL